MSSSPTPRPVTRRAVLGTMVAGAAAVALPTAFPARGAAAAGYAPVPLPLPALRIPKIDLGVEQQPNSKIQWMQDAKLGMFIHWGVYSGPAKGEWYQYNSGIRPEVYAKFFTEATSQQFTASAYDPTQFARLAQDMGAKYTVLTARHHEGFCLYPSTFPGSFHAGQAPMGKDLIAGYVDAIRDAGLRVGVYFSPLSWRYPGYYDPTGTDCKPNKFGYTTDPAHKENARIMKNEVYQNVRELVKNYGAFDDFWWDGGWMSQQGTDAAGGYFWEPGQFRDPSNDWPVDAAYSETDGATGRPLGLTGLVRKYQPNIVATSRSGWVGDYKSEEGGSVPTGPIRSGLVAEKCFTIGGAWGYVAGSGVKSYTSVMNILVNSWVRNITCLVNVGPDRTGVVPSNQAAVLRQVGKFMAANGKAIYATRGGPWDPVEGQVGFTSSGNTVYVHLLPGLSGSSVTTPSIGDAAVTRVFDLISGNTLSHSLSGDRRVTVSGIDRTRYPEDTIVGITLDRSVQPADIAAGRTATAPSQQPGRSASAVLDGRTETRWCAADGATGHRLTVDLGFTRAVTGTRIAWEFAADYRYLVEASTDNSSWRTVIDRRQTATTSQVHVATLAVSARYLRLTVTGLPAGKYASVRNFEVYDRPFTASTGTYTLVHSASGKAVDVANASTADGAKIILYTSSGATNQQWEIITAPSGGYRIANVRSDKLLESRGNSAVGAAVDQYTDNFGDNQWWRLVPGSAAGSVRIINVRNGFALAPEGGATANGTTLVQVAAANTAVQDWKLVEV